MINTLRHLLHLPNMWDAFVLNKGCCLKVLSKCLKVFSLIIKCLIVPVALAQYVVCGCFEQGTGGTDKWTCKPEERKVKQIFFLQNQTLKRETEKQVTKHHHS